MVDKEGGWGTYYTHTKYNSVDTHLKIPMLEFDYYDIGVSRRR